MSIQSISEIQRKPKDAQDGDYCGYSIANFQAAFDLLCEDCGGYRNGKEVAEQIIKELVE